MPSMLMNNQQLKYSASVEDRVILTMASSEAEGGTGLERFEGKLNKLLKYQQEANKAQQETYKAQQELKEIQRKIDRDIEELKNEWKEETELQKKRAFALSQKQAREAEAQQAAMAAAANAKLTQQNLTPPTGSPVRHIHHENAPAGNFTFRVPSPINFVNENKPVNPKPESLLMTSSTATTLPDYYAGAKISSTERRKPMDSISQVIPICESIPAHHAGPAFKDAASKVGASASKSSTFAPKQFSTPINEPPAPQKTSLFGGDHRPLIAGSTPMLQSREAPPSAGLGASKWSDKASATSKASPLTPGKPQ